MAFKSSSICPCSHWLIKESRQHDIYAKATSSKNKTDYCKNKQERKRIAMTNIIFHILLFAYTYLVFVAAR